MLFRSQSKLGEAFDAAKSYRPNKADWLEGRWSGLRAATGDEADAPATAVALDTLREVGRALATVPKNFAINPKIARQLEAKAEMFESGQGIDWATAESLAFAMSRVSIQSA